MTTFMALVLRSSGSNTSSAIEELDLTALPDAEVVVNVAASSLNYKDGMAICGKGKIVHAFPMVPGIDFAGVVETSKSPRYSPGDRVVLTGWGVGEKHWGGLSEKAAVSADWLIPLPAGVEFAQAMAFGTAGLTAMLCVDALEHHAIDKAKPVLVTGAAGGVGSIAVAILARLGYRVTASSGRPELADYLRAIGAQDLIAREELSAPGKPLASERWGGVIDTVGGTTLVNALAATAYRGAVAVCGLAGGADFNGTVMPFILRGVTLVGIDSVRCPEPERMAAWSRLHAIFPDGLPEAMVSHIGLADVPAKAAKILTGKVRGRIVVDIGRV